MTSYGALPTHSQQQEQQEEKAPWRERLGEHLENQIFHVVVLCLTLVDALCVFIQIFYTFFHECQAPLLLSSSRRWLFIAFEVAEVVSVIICVVFLLEIILSLVAFGPKYYLPGWPHWKLHVFDAAGKQLIRHYCLYSYSISGHNYFYTRVYLEGKRERSCWVNDTR
jgi:hypothetical protein